LYRKRESVGNLAFNWGIEWATLAMAKGKKLDDSQSRFMPIVLAIRFPKTIPFRNCWQ